MVERNEILESILSGIERVIHVCLTKRDGGGAGEKIMHTKGPWTLKEEKGGGFHHIGIIAKDGRTEFEVGCAAVKFIPDAEALANARLIAAAPELADCLEAILKITCGTCEGGDERCVTADGLDACLVAREAKAVLAKMREGTG